MMERCCSSYQSLQRRLVSIIGLLAILSVARVSVADTQSATGPSGHKSLTLTHISPQRAKEILDPIQLAVVSLLPSTTDTVLVTGSPELVQKAAVILEIVDTTEPYEIKRLRSDSSPHALPSNDEIAAAVGNVCIGTFSRPPRYTNKAKAIIDAYNGSVWAIAPALKIRDIATALEMGPEALARHNAFSDRITDGAVLQALQADAMLEARFTAPAGSRKANPAFANDVPSQRSDGLASSSSRFMPVTAAQGVPGGQPEGNTTTLPARTVTPAASETTSAGYSGGAAEPNGGAAAALQPGQTVQAQPAQETATPVGPAAATSMPAASDTIADTGAADSTVMDLPNANHIVDVTLPDKLPVIQFLDLVGKYLNLTYVYDPQDVAGDVTLKINGNLRGSMKVKDLYYLLESVLRFKGLAMTRHRSVVNIVKKENVLEIDPRIVGPDEAAGMPGDAVVTCVFKLEHIDTTSAKNLLMGMKVPMGEVTPLEETSTIIVTAYAYRMERIEQLLSIVDRPGEPRKFQYRQLRYTMAKALADKVKALAEQLQGVSVTVAESEPMPTLPRNPGENDAQYNQRLTVYRAQLAASRAATGARSATPKPEQNRPSIYLDADERTNRILMIGIAKQLDIVNRLVDSLDVEQQVLRDFQLYQMKHVDAQDVAKKLQELGVISKVPESSASPRPTTTTTTPRTTQPLTPDETRLRLLQEQQRIAAGLPPLTTTEPTQQGPVEEPQVVVVEATNSLLVNATPEQHAQIQRIIQFVDSEMLRDDIPYKIYQLENSSPDHMAEILKSLIQETTQNKDKEGKIVETTTVKKIQDEISIVPDPNSYSLIVYGNKKNQEWISDLIKQLDQRRPQVLINVTLVEITESDAFQSDLNVINSIPDLTATSGLTGNISGSVTSDSILSKLSSSGRSQFADLQANNGTLSAFYGDKHVNLLLSAMEQKHYGRVLAKPSILANDNQPGAISRANTTYVETQSSIPVSTSGTGTTTAVPTFTTSTNFQAYNSGIELKITPHISKGDLLRLDIEVNRSDFTSQGGTKPPDLRKDTLNTGATLPDGKTVILGGLLDLNHAKNVSKVPLLGDIPLIGGFFRSIDNSGSDSKLYMFIKAEIIRPATLAKGMDDLQNISERSRNAFEAHEKEFQDYQTWPGMKSEPIDPANVLNAQ